MGARVLIVGVAATASLAYGCEKVSTKYCATHNDVRNCGFLDAAIDAPPPCMSDMDCTGMLKRCDLAAGQCVQCLGSADCSGSNAICNTGTHMCTGCVVNSDCALSDVCLLDGRCADMTAVVYVDGGSGATTGSCGTKAMPCKTITYAQTQAGGKSIFKLANAITDPGVMLPVGSTTFIGDPGSKVTSAKDVFTAVAGTDVTMIGVTLDCAGAGKSGILATSATLRLHGITVTGCGMPGISTTMGGTVDMYASTIVGNPGGGVMADKGGSIDVENCIIVRNGNTATQSPGGFSWLATNPGNNIFQFNTVVDNLVMKSDAMHSAGVSCGMLNTLAMPNNLIARNLDMTGAASDTVPTGCLFTGSLTSATNVNFVHDSGTPYDYHLLPTSSTAIDQAPDGSPSIDTDIDGQHRPFGSGKDYGADEYTP